jgi:hypothetical protein
MTKVEKEVYKLPQYWASALINGDYSGIDDDEELQIKEFLASVPQGFYCVECSEESSFSYYNDSNTNYGCDVSEYTFIKINQ